MGGGDKITELRPVESNQFQFINEICCNHQKSESHGRNNEIKSPLKFSGTI